MILQARGCNPNENVEHAFQEWNMSIKPIWLMMITIYAGIMEIKWDMISKILAAIL